MDCVEETPIDVDSNVQPIPRRDRRKRRPVSNQGSLVSGRESIKAARGCPRSRLGSIRISGGRRLCVLIALESVRIRNSEHGNSIRNRRV
jgi:hypothetical protein